MTADQLIGILAPLMRQERAELARRAGFLQEELESTVERGQYFDCALAVLDAHLKGELPEPRVTGDHVIQGPWAS